MCMLEVVESVSDWKRLGLTLGLLYQPTLTDIETYRRGKPDECRIYRHALSMATTTRQCRSPFMECVESCTEANGRA